MHLNKTKILFIIAGILVLIIIFALTLILTPADETQIPAGPTPTPVGLNEQGEQIIPGHREEEPFPSPNPTYTELLKSQPFWDQLPHRTTIYLIEYIMHNDTIRITTIDPGDADPNRDRLIQSYRNQALGWLEARGADFNELNIEYVPEN